MHPDGLVGEYVASGVGGVVLAGMCEWLVVAVDADDISSCERVALIAGRLDVQPSGACAHAFGETVHAIVDAIENEFAEACLGHIVEVSPGEREGEGVAEEGAVVVGSQQTPVVVFSHAEQRGFALGAIVLVAVGEEFDGVGFLGGVCER